MARGEKMNARAQILAKLKAASSSAHVENKGYCPHVPSDLIAEFLSKAVAADANVHEIASAEDIPVRLESLFSERSNETPLHIAPGSPLCDLPWARAPYLRLCDTPPTGEAVALSAADFAIAETGTLVFLSGAARPSSWHFLPGIECVLVRRALIVPTLEDLFAKLADQDMPATLNLVTGPSRTADIEQTIERGAHGPRSLHIFLTGS